MMLSVGAVPPAVFGLDAAALPVPDAGVVDDRFVAAGG
jgi:hypothetical protein